MPVTLHVFREFKRLFWNLIQKYDQYNKRKPTKWQIRLSAILENVIYHRFFLMKIKYEISEHQLNKEADPIMTRKVLCHFHIIIKENFYFDTLRVLEYYKRHFGKILIDSKSFEIHFMALTTSLFFPCYWHKMKR